MEDEIVFRYINGVKRPIKVNHLYAESERWAKRLTSKELYDIRKYTLNSLETGDEKNSNKFFAKLNEYLRCKDKDIGLYDDYYEEYSKSISSGINKFNLKNQVFCYRGSRIDETNGTEEGKTYINPSFCSTSIDSEKAFNSKYEYIILVPTKARCAFLGNASKFKSQKELLLDKKTQFKVISRKGYLIELEVIL